MKTKSGGGRDFTTGRAARELRVSPNHIRGLCQAGMVAARATRGGHWRIPMEEINRLRNEGVPDPPPITPTEFRTDTAEGPALTMTAGNQAARHPVLLADPSKDAIASADEVVRLGNEVKALELKRAKEENLDWFRERQRKEADARAVRERELLERNVKRLREKWEQDCLAYGFRCVPEEAPEQVRLPVSQCVREALLELSPGDSEEVVGQLVGAAVEKALRPWRHGKEIDRIAQEAKAHLPYWARGRSGLLTEWELRAIQTARPAIAALGDDATVHEMRAAAAIAGQEVAAECADAEAKRMTVASVFLPNTSSEQENARHAVRAALEELPVGCSRAQLERVRDEALVPFKAADEHARAHTLAERDANLYLLHVDSFLARIPSDRYSNRNLASSYGRYQLAQELKKEFRPILIEEILSETLTVEDAHCIIEAWLHRKLPQR